MKILILEDGPKVAGLLCRSLRSEGHWPFWVASLEDLAELDPATEKYEIAIFDRMIGTRDALSIIPAFKKKFSHCPVLVLSVINTPEERARALDLGADDYVGKPYSLLELSSRIRALKRRIDPEKEEKTFLQLGHFQMDLLTHRVLFQEQKLYFSAKEFQIMVLLMRRPGQIYNKYQLLNQIWDLQQEITSNVVEAHIRNIRKKLQEAKVDFQVRGQRNVGYWIET